MEDFSKLFKERVDASIIAFNNNLRRIRAGSAHPDIISSIQVDYYGEPSAIAKMANVKIENSSQLLITPYEKAHVKSIAEAIQAEINKSDLGITVNDVGHALYVNVPGLTEEKREFFVKKSKEVAEEAKISIRNIRHEVIKKINNDKEITENHKKLILEEIQGILNNINNVIENDLKHKSDDLMKV